MTDKTATQNLTRTTSTDDHRLTALYLETLATEVDQRMVAQYRNIRRSQVPPAALVQMNEPRAVRSDDTMPNAVFDTVVFDTTGDLVDLAAAPQSITLRSPGYWVVGGYLETVGWPTGSGDMQVWLQSGGSTRTVGFRDGNLGFVSGAFSVHEQTDYPLTETCALGVKFTGTLPGGAEPTTLLFAEMWAYKVRDL